MKFNNRDNERVELPDGSLVYIARHTATAYQIRLIKDDLEYVLMGKRGALMHDHVGKWCMPCGFLDWDEHVRHAAMREVYEESGLNILEVKEKYKIIIDYTVRPYRIKSNLNSPMQNVVHHYGIMFEADEFPEIHTRFAKGEVDETRWVPIEEVKHLECAYDHKEIITQDNYSDSDDYYDDSEFNF